MDRRTELLLQEIAFCQRMANPDSWHNDHYIFAADRMAFAAYLILQFHDNYDPDTAKAIVTNAAFCY